MLRAVLVLLTAAVCLSLLASASGFITGPLEANAHALFQGSGNSISGHVFGDERRAASEVNVELLDDLNRTVARTRTDSSGRFLFNRLQAGRYRVRVMPYKSGFAEQTQEVEITNIPQRLPNGGVRMSGIENVQLDFYLKARAEGRARAASGPAGTVFVQDVPVEARKIYERAVADLLGGKAEAGLNGLRKAVEIFPAYFEALEQLGNEHIKREQYEAAYLELSRALEVNPRSPSARYALGYALYGLKRPTEAAEALRRAVSLNPALVNAQLLLGSLLRQSGNYEEAEQHLKRAKELSKTSVPEIHWQLALLYGNNLKRYREAADELELFLKAQPDSRDIEGIKKLIKHFREKAAKG